MVTMNDYRARHADALADAAKHARATYPEESCGLVVSGRYIACENQSAAPETHEDAPGCACRLCSFKISDEIYLEHAADLEMVVHSHPGGPIYPSKADMAGQEATDVAWAIIALDESRVADPIIWGGDCPVPDLIGREFIHGPQDCYALIRDVFALGAEGCKAQGVEGWPYAPVTLPVYPRNDEWWNADEDNFYEEKPQELGFVEITSEEARPGDVFLCAVRSERLNHGGLLVGDGLILHHLPNRLSRREPAGMWAHSAEKWIRLEGAPHAA